MSNGDSKDRYPWLKSNRPSQHQWAEKYLIKKTAYSPFRLDGSSNYEHLVTALDKLAEPQPGDNAKENGYLRIQRVKLAWYQRQYREKCKTKKGTKKPFNNYLDKNLINKLRDLAESKNMAMNAVLEELIERAYDYEYFEEKKREEELNQRIDTLTKKLKAYENQLLPVEEQLSIKTTLAETKKKLKEEKDFNDELLWELCQNLAQLESAGLAKKKLNTKQHLRAQDLHKELMGLTQRRMNNIMNKLCPPTKKSNDPT